MGDKDLEEERIAQMVRDAYWIDIRQEQEIELINAEKRGEEKGREEERKQRIESVKRRIGRTLNWLFGVPIEQILPYLEGKSVDELDEIFNLLCDSETYEEFHASL